MHICAEPGSTGREQAATKSGLPQGVIYLSLRQVPELEQMNQALEIPPLTISSSHYQGAQLCCR